MKWLFVIFAAFLLVGCEKQQQQQPHVTISNGKDAIKINVELAQTQEEITKGLMYRTELGEDQGMLFIFAEEAERFFWMKNTKIPLDMIFIAEDGRIVKIQHAIPCTTSQCRLYPSQSPAKYVLEVNTNFSQKNNIKEGDYVKI